MFPKNRKIWQSRGESLVSWHSHSSSSSASGLLFAGDLFETEAARIAFNFTLVSLSLTVKNHSEALPPSEPPPKVGNE